MSKRIGLVFTLAIAATAMAAPVSTAAAGRISIDVIENFQTVVPVRDDGFPVASLMRADCAFVVRLELRDGSSIETMQCQLSDAPMSNKVYQGVAPTHTYKLTGGACEWWSDYWYNKAGLDVAAASFRLVVYPNGRVFTVSTYGADPLACE